MKGRLLVVSHASVLQVNQHVYASLRERGWDLLLVVPRRWGHEYSIDGFDATPLPSLADCFLPLPTLLTGQPQRHLYRAWLGKMIADFDPTFAFLEEESFSLPALQWSLAARRAHAPFAVQAAENLDRPLQAPARLARWSTLRHASLVAARSPAAARLARRWGATGAVEVIPHAVPEWPRREGRETGRAFTIGYCGRLVREKGIWDLVHATSRLDAPVRLLLVGDGLLREELQRYALPNGELVVAHDVSHEDMADAYAQMDVVVLPSHTTARWAEQFGRVLVEALWCGVPVIGSSSGEIPWVIEVTGGGMVFPEGDVEALARALETMRRDAEQRERFATTGSAAVARLFGVDAVAQELDEALRACSAPRNADR